MWICLGMASVGLLVGSLVGMSNDHLSRILLGFLFAFIGGSITALLYKLPKEERKLAGSALFSLSLSCLVGVYSGIIVTQYKLLTPGEHRVWTEGKTGYLDGLDQNSLKVILDTYKAGGYDLNQTIERINELPQKQSDRGER